MKTCNGCQREYPDECIQTIDIQVNGELTRCLRCPLCALREINLAHGLPPGGHQFRPGSAADQLYRRALNHLHKERSDAEATEEPS